MKKTGLTTLLKAGITGFVIFYAALTQGATLSGLVEFSTDASGSFYNGSVWNTRGGDTAVNLWVIRGTNLHGVFANGPSDSQAGISIPLAAGEHTFVVYANQGGFTPHHGLNLFFNGNNSSPGISVFGATQTSTEEPYPTFSANGANTLTLAFRSVRGANTLVFQDGSTRIELINYRFADFDVYNTDRVSQRSTSPDGGADFIGQFTLRVTEGTSPPSTADFDVSRDFSLTSNPGGPWSYGYMNVLGLGFTLLTHSQYSPDNNNLMIFSWSKNGYEPVAVYKNQTSETSISDGGYGVYPPGTVWFYGGVEGNVDNFGVIRFTVPAGKAGNYRVEASVRTYLDGPLSRDADFYVLRNGSQVFSRFLGPNSGTDYTNIFSLAVGDTVDFVCGRGQDNVSYGSGLKIKASLTATDTPPPPSSADFDVSRDFSTNANPGAAWAYGYVSTLGGPFSTYNHGQFGYGDNPVAVFNWSKNGYEPGAVYFNPSSETSIGNNGYGVFPPGTVFFFPGDQPYHPDKFAVIRLTIPAGKGGRYRLDTTVRSHLNGALSRDADYHIHKNGTEIYSHFVPPESSNSHTTEVVVAAGDTIDFACGPGGDGIAHGSGLKIQAQLTKISAEEPPPPPPPAAIELSGLVEFSADANGNFFNGSVWNTRGGDTAVNLWVINGAHLNGPFVNGPSDAQAGISLPLSEGDHTFTIYGAQGGFTAHHGLNLFFNGSNSAPRISVFGATQTSSNTPSFAANGGSTLTLAFQPTPGANTLAFTNGDIRVQLIAYRWAAPAVHNIDRTSQKVVGPEGTADFIGQFSLRVSKIPPPPPPALITLSGLAEFSTDAAGNFYNGSIWSTHDDPFWIVKSWLIHSANLQGPFINGPSGSQAEILVPLSEGEHTFTFFANRGGFTAHHGLNLFFNGNNATPRISVFGATQTSSNSVPPFTANGGNTVTIANAPVPGANSLVFEDGSIRVELLNYRFANTSVHNLDRVSQTSTTPDGTTDFIGQFTLRISKVPEAPSIPRLTGLLEFSTDTIGNFFNGSVWNTRGGDTAVNLWVAKGTDLQAPFVNGPSDSAAGINLQLEPGVNEFVIYGNQGGPTPHHGLNLFFNGNNVNPAISVFGPTQTSPNPPFPPFAANSSPSTLTLAFQSIPGAGTLVYQQGDVHVRLTDYRWADPSVYNINRVSQPVATPDGGPDFIGRFTLVVSIGPGSPPSAHIALAPQLELPGAPHALVVACDGHGAEIVLDGRGSTDADGDALSYAWFLTGSQQPFSTDPVVRTSADVGLHSVTLRVSDAQSSANATVVFEVISPAEAAAQISLLMNAADLSRKYRQPLQASLRSAIQALEDGKFRAAIGQLAAFDNKVRAQLESSHPELAASLSAAAQGLIEALENCAGEEE